MEEKLNYLYIWTRWADNNSDVHDYRPIQAGCDVNCHESVAFIQLEA